MTLRNALDRELRRGRRLPAHARRREARRLAAAVAAVGYGRFSIEVPGDPEATRAAMQGASIGVGILEASRGVVRLIDSFLGRRT